MYKTFVHRNIYNLSRENKLKICVYTGVTIIIKTDVPSYSIALQYVIKPLTTYNPGAKLNIIPILIN